MTTHEREDHAATEGSDDLRDADGAVEEAEVGTHVTIALQGIGDDGEWHGEHGGPAATNEQEGYDQHCRSYRQQGGVSGFK